LPPAHANLIEWADSIYCMEDHHKDAIANRFPWAVDKITVLNIPDIFNYRAPNLIRMLENAFAEEFSVAA